MNSNLRSVVFDMVSRLEKDQDLENVIACITYKYSESALNSYTNASSSVRSVVTSFVSKIKEEVVSLSGKFISYDLMLKQAKMINKDNFSLYNDDDINKIYKIYLDKRAVVPFDISIYKPEMYKVSDLTIKEDFDLEKTHKNIMRNIILYYMSKYNFPANYMEILSAQSDDGTVGKEILFAIKNISPSTIWQDYRKGAFNIDIYSLETEGTYVKLITK